MVLSFLLYFYCRNHNLLTVGFMPVPPGHRQQTGSTRRLYALRTVGRLVAMLPDATIIRR